MTMGDKERILMTLLQRLVGLDGNEYAKKNGFPYAYPDRDPPLGSMVICQSSGAHPWSVGWVVESRPSEAHCVIREIGSARTCNVSNDSFYVIHNIDRLSLLEGDRHGFLSKVHKAFRRGDKYRYRFGGLDFDDDKATIWIREVFGGHREHGSEPFPVVMPWNKRTSIKSILDAMQSAGYGTRDFSARTPAAEARQ